MRAPWTRAPGHARSSVELDPVTREPFDLLEVESFYAELRERLAATFPALADRKRCGSPDDRARIERR
jgi:hypothetical protein